MHSVITISISCEKGGGESFRVSHGVMVGLMRARRSERHVAFSMDKYVRDSDMVMGNVDSLIHCCTSSEVAQVYARKATAFVAVAA